MSSRKVTDPALLAQLDGAPKSTKVTDPALLSQLEYGDVTGTAGQNFAAGMGKAVVDVGRGAQQMLSNVPGLNRLDVFNPEKVRQGIYESRRLDAPLMATGAGTAGNVAGNVVMGAVTAPIPGANTAAGATLIGAGMGALQPVTDEESRLGNTVMGGAGGYIGKRVGDAVVSAVGNQVAKSTAAKAAEKARNVVADETLAASQGAGYVVPPSMAGSGVGSRLLEGVSGKYKTNQLAGIKNQQVTNRLAKEAIGLSDDAPLTPATLQQVRDAAYRPYQEIAALPVNPATPGQAGNAMFNVPAKQGQKGFNPAEALEELKQARADAKGYFEAYNRSANPRQLKIAKGLDAKAESLEKSIEDYATSVGRADLVPDLREARQLIAKTYTVERALKRGGGDVDAKVLGRLYDKQKPLTAELETIGRFASKYNDVAGVPKSGNANPLTVIDVGYAGLGGMTLSPWAAALPAARVAARYGILSQPYQRAMVPPTYSISGMLKGADALAPVAQRALPFVTPAAFLNLE